MNQKHTETVQINYSSQHESTHRAQAPAPIAIVLWILAVYPWLGFGVYLCFAWPFRMLGIHLFPDKRAEAKASKPVVRNSQQKYTDELQSEKQLLENQVTEVERQNALRAEITDLERRLAEANKKLTS